jgi:hypothetical protein
MLKIKSSHHLHLPHLDLSSASMQLSVVRDDGDELTQAISDATRENDDTWTLDERPDSDQLTQFWSEVIDDVQHDPEWFNFSDE